jgi:hypothetical protein
MLPAGHNAWISVFKEEGIEKDGIEKYESYSACCGEHLMLGLDAFRKTIKKKEGED